MWRYRNQKTQSDTSDIELKKSFEDMQKPSVN